MLRKRNDYPRVITPALPVVWASLHEPDFEYKDEGEFHVRLRADPSDPQVQAMIAQAEELLDEAYAAKKSELEKEKKGALLKKLNRAPVLAEEVDRETGEPTGFVTLRAGMKHHIEIKNGPKAGQSFDKYPDIFDAKRTKLRRAPKVGSGSEIKAAVRIMDYFMPKDATVGIRFELEGAQIIKLVTGGERNASSYGFEEEDGDVIQDTGGFDEDVTGGFEADEAIEDTAPRRSARDF